MRAEIANRQLIEQRRGFVWWSVGLVALIALLALSWPSIESVGDLDSVAENFPDAAKQLFGLAQPLSSPVGYLDSQLFAYFLPILLLVFGVGKGAKTIAGQEEDGRMELLSSLPVSRTRIVCEKALALCVSVLSIGVVVWLSLAIFCPLVDLHVGWGELAAATLGSTLVAIDGTLGALAFSALTGRGGLAIAIPSAVIAGTYIAGALAVTVDFLEPFKGLSVIYWAQRNEPLANGFQLTNILVLLAIAVAMLGIAIFGFHRRDLHLG